jgi:hypothetical protein
VNRKGLPSSTIGPRLAGSAVVALLLLVGCSEPRTPAAPGPTPAAPSASPVETPSASVSESPTSSASPLSPSPDGSASPSVSLDPGSPTPAVAPSTGERALALSDFFNPPSDWSEARYTIPAVGELTGIGAKVNTCDKDDADVLEFRNDTRYRSLSLKAGPGNQSLDSAKKLVVAVYDNEDFIDSVTAAYGKVGTLRDIKIENVSALKLRVYLDDAKGCNTRGMFAVLYDIEVS